jgi:two-component system, cell cycle response regulator DivK
VIPQDMLVLIGEDEPDNQVILQTVVESLVGVRAEVAGDGLAVLASIQRERPSVILLDLMMPGLDGFQVTRQLKGNPDTATIPIVAVSAMARPDDRETALAAGCDEFVRKPFELDDLEAVIRSYLVDVATRTNGTSNTGGPGC